MLHVGISTNVNAKVDARMLLTKVGNNIGQPLCACADKSANAQCTDFNTVDLSGDFTYLVFGGDNVLNVTFQILHVIRGQNAAFGADDQLHAQILF